MLGTIQEILVPMGHDGTCPQVLGAALSVYSGMCRSLPVSPLRMCARGVRGWAGSGVGKFSFSFWVLKISFCNLAGLYLLTSASVSWMLRNHTWLHVAQASFEVAATFELLTLLTSSAGDMSVITPGFSFP